MNQAAAQYPVEFFYLGSATWISFQGYFTHRRHTRTHTGIAAGACVTWTGRCANVFLQRVPGTTVCTLSTPLGMQRTTFGALVLEFGLGQALVLVFRCELFELWGNTHTLNGIVLCLNHFYRVPLQQKCGACLRDELQMLNNDAI